MANRRIKPGQIPEWRRGAIFWKPLADGREVTIYPLLYNHARLCVGPLGDEYGYDIAYTYETHEAAIAAAEEWDGESHQHPRGYVKIEAGDDHDTEKRSEIPKAGDLARVKDTDEVAVEEHEHRPTMIAVKRELRNGRKIIFEGERKEDTSGNIYCQVEGAIHVYDPDGVRDEPVPQQRIAGERCALNNCLGQLRPAREGETGVADWTKMLHCDVCGRSYNKASSEQGTSGTPPADEQTIFDKGIWENLR